MFLTYQTSLLGFTLATGNEMKEVLRKIGLVGNWLVLGGGGIFITAAGLLGGGSQDQFNLIFGIVLLVIALIAHKIINWVFA